MDMTRIDVTGATPLDRASALARPARMTTALGLLLLLVIVPVIVLRLAAELLMKDGHFILGFARACGEATLASFRKR